MSEFSLQDLGMKICINYQVRKVEVPTLFFIVIYFVERFFCKTRQINEVVSFNFSLHIKHTANIFDIEIKGGFAGNKSLIF